MFNAFNPYGELQAEEQQAPLGRGSACRFPAPTLILSDVDLPLCRSHHPGRLHTFSQPDNVMVAGGYAVTMPTPAAAAVVAATAG